MANVLKSSEARSIAPIVLLDCRAVWSRVCEFTGMVAYRSLPSNVDTSVSLISDNDAHFASFFAISNTISSASCLATMGL